MLQKEKVQTLTHHKGYFLKDPHSLVAEQFRMLRTNIEFMSIDQPIKHLIVTAADKAAGKTTVSFNLAVALALQHKRVLLVDTDLRKPSVHKVLDVTNEKGLTSLLMDRILTSQQVIKKTTLSNLSVMTSGVIPPNPAECLASNQMDEIMQELEPHFDIIIYDTPPITLVADAQIMAGKTDATLFVVRKDKDSKADIRKSKALLDAANARIIGAVFNREERKESQHYYYTPDKKPQT